MGESDAKDGQVFAASDGSAELRCWGGFSDASPRALPEALAEPRRQVTYKRAGESFFVLSGHVDGRIFYRRTILAQGVLAAFERTCDPPLKTLFDPVIRDLSAGFIIDPAFAHH